MQVKSLFVFSVFLLLFSSQVRAQQCAKWNDLLWKFNINVEGYINPTIQVLNSDGDFVDMKTTEISFIGFSLTHRQKNGKLAFELGFGTSYHLGLFNGHEYGQTSDGESISNTHQVAGPFTVTGKFNMLFRLNPNPNYTKGKHKKAKYFVLGIERLMHFGAGDEDMSEDQNGTITLSNEALGLTRFKVGVNFGDLDKVNWGVFLNYRTGMASDILTNASGVGVSVFCRAPIGMK